MRKNSRFRVVDIVTFTSQVILGVAAVIFGLITSHEVFIPMGIAIGCGGIGYLSSLIAYTKKQENAHPEMFDERANLISEKAASLSFKATFIALEAALLFSMLPYEMPYYVLPSTIGFLMIVSAISYLLAHRFYRQRYLGIWMVSLILRADNLH